ncbi:hypothetical protein NZK35_03485 [Stieleria sp. ICT_E10.1]|uniref:hypothetical protein n=1 Tax=Stieleria sedimenti TaxID=2976331 RepID=UPI00218005B9|nr:hypothetical protein [Stieleria sedimenti]MCS7465736.1 hypothetical protein [Stieleria sedimenti]
MAITIKPTEIADVDAIFALRNDPDVLRHQYQPRKGETPASFEKNLAGHPNVLGIPFRCTSIFDNGVLVGHVMQHFGPGPEGRRFDPKTMCRRSRRPIPEPSSLGRR